jgi:hypothetical protein
VLQQQHQPDFSQGECLTSLHLVVQFPCPSVFNEWLFRSDIELHVDNEANFQNLASAACSITMYYDHHYV